ncbi:MAG: family acetyltransferase [Clostridiales bacterium]|jgi:RimJ/RimL family protein N-acetyltransferase|nr:family acetyltransferase [Clostridiales bacterium]
MIGHVYFAQSEPPQFRTWEIGYVFNPKFYGNGYATEACKRILQYGFQNEKAHRIVAEANVKNQASWKLLERLSMRREAHMFQNVFFKKTSDGKPIWNDSYGYAILSTEYKGV